MKFHEMIKEFPKNRNHKSALGYLIQHTPRYITEIETANIVNFESYLIGVDTVLHCLQMFDIPDDIGEILQ